MLGALMLPVLALHAGDDQYMASLALPLDQSSKERQAALNDTLSSLHPAEHLAPKITTSPKGCYVLYGDLFKTGRNYAMVELPTDVGGIGFAAYVNKNWELRGLWSLTPVWRPKGSNKYAGGYLLPIEPSERPFWMQQLSNDGPPEVIAVGDVSKYWQEHYIMHFDVKAQRLAMVAQCMSAKFQDGWVILPYDSGHRSVFRGWEFMQWNTGKLV